MWPRDKRKITVCQRGRPRESTKTECAADSGTVKDGAARPIMDWLIGCVALLHLVVAPFTKVEESFNLQACHDLLYNGLHLEQYDHLAFPGVVPRTFVGPVLVSAMAYPFVAVIKFFGFSKFLSQYIVRGILGLLVLFAWRRFRKQLQVAFGPSVTFWFTLVTASQFHFMYYLSRPLPNTFGLAVALLAFSYWLEQRHGAMIWTCGIAVLIFRSELCLLLGPMLLADLLTRKLSTVPFLKYSIPAGFICLATTIAIDSLFWGRLLWPEGEVFWFNTYKNQSPNWGTSPFLWYWYSALPRALGLSLPLIPVGLVLDKRVQALMTPAIIFVVAYSFLPHKELRFIIYVFPIFNVAVARACHYFWEGREKSGMRQLFALGSALHLLGNISFTTLLLTISANNYPGGLAMHNLHQVVPQDTNVNVHIDNFAAQTGVSRFTQLYDHWKYNKTEKLKAGGQAMRSFTHILVEAKSKYSYNLKHYTTSHEILNHVESFSHLSFNYQQFPPVKIRVKPSIFLLKNVIEEDIDWSLFSIEDKDASEELDEGKVEYVHDVKPEPKEEAEDASKDREPKDDESEVMKSSEMQANLGIDGSEEKVILEIGDQADEDGDDDEDDEDGDDDDNAGIIKEQDEETENAEVTQEEEKLLEPKLPEEGCFAPKGEPEILVADIDSSEDDYADELLQSKMLKDVKKSEDSTHGEDVDAIENKLSDESSEGVCFDGCGRTDNTENEMEVEDDQRDEIPVEYEEEEEDSTERYLEENEEKQTVFVELASELDEDTEVSAKEFDNGDQITSPLLSETNSDIVEHASPLWSENNPDKIERNSPLLSENNHDKIELNSPLLSENNPNKVEHASPLLSENNPDKVEHSSLLLSENNQDQVEHTSPLLSENNPNNVEDTSPFLSENSPDKIEHNSPSLSENLNH